MNTNENTIDQLLIQKKYKQKYMSSFGPFGEQIVSHKDFSINSEQEFNLDKFGSFN